MNNTCIVLHSTPGRTRLKLNHLNMRINKLEAKLRSIPGIVSATYSELTNSVVLYHQYKLLPEIFLHYISAFVEERSIKKTKLLNDSKANVKRHIRELALVLGTFIISKMWVTPLIISTPLGGLTPTTATILYACRDIMKNGLMCLLKPSPDTLTTAAILASIKKGSPQSALVIYIMSTISEILTEYTISKTRRYVRDMMEVDTLFAWLITQNGEEIKVQTDKVKIGDQIVVFQGEKVPFDGTVMMYNGLVDQSSITGEYMPVHVSKGSYIYAGSIVTEGKVSIIVDKVGEDLAVNRMIKLIEEAQDKQASIQMMSDKFTDKVVPISFVLAGIIYIFTKDWNRVLNMLVIDYVCGVKLSTATAISASIGKAAQKGVLVKGGQTLEHLSKVNTVVFDKTGTITEGQPVVLNIHTFNGYTQNEVLGYAASAEEHSSHPIAEAIRSEAQFRRVDVPEHDDESFETTVGKGLSVLVNDELILVGSRGFMEDFEIELSTNLATGIFIAKDKQLIGIIDIDDHVRQGMNRCINQMRRMGIDEVVMLTGDYKQSAKKVASQISIDEYFAEVMPQEKASFVRFLKREKDRTIMMVGDGVNDAPALAYADIGVALGAKKTDIAMETADVVIHSDNPLLLSDVVKLSQQTMQTIKQNIWATIIINTAAITLGTIGVIQPTVGAAIHNTATIVVVLNSAKLIIQGGRMNGFQIQDHSFITRKDKAYHTGISKHKRALCY
ncbi:cation-translocating P-type ATPase [Schinkia azotoformans]|uniref:heavy metal translocating P-type ATPase n=1 Tax=Schinkia azotoformans TaxID=1454 RepID=UPI002E1FBFE6|nr:cation-translocating P-type ATPase [Schinkia azotoformans]